MSKRDKWAAWLLQRRFGGDVQRMRTVLQELYTLRDGVLQHAEIQEGDVLLDVGSGDGLIAFGAFDQMPVGRVIMSDISHDILTHARQLVHEMNVVACCHLLQAPAEQLPLKSSSVDVITTRSVLIYVRDKRAAFAEFYRLLRADGRISLFEPINSYFDDDDPTWFWYFDVTPVQEVAGKVANLYRRLQPRDSDPMLDFDERDLLNMAEEAGFKALNLRLDVNISAVKDIEWETLINIAGNPSIPTLAEAMQEVLTPAESDALVAHIKPQLERGEATRRLALAYLWARKES